MNKKQLILAIADGEECDREFKSAKGGIPGSMWETYSALANTEGGRIVLGVNERGGRHVVEGLDHANKARKQIWDCLNNRGKVSDNLLCEADVEIKDVDGKKVIVMHVPRATRRQRPVFIGQNPLAGTYRRNYEGDYRCTKDEVGRMLADQAEEPADSLILECFTLNDLDGDSIKQYRRRFASNSPDHPWLSEGTRGLLEKLGAWRKDRRTGEKGLTVAGLLMFGKQEAIQDPSAIPEFHLDYREHLSTDSEQRWSDRITIDGMWAGNLFQFYQRVIQRLSADLKIPFRLGPELYRRDDTFVHEAIREALVNALIHADYRGQGGVVIDKFANRFEMSNPGNLLISFRQLLQGGISECRNKSLQQMFQRIGGGEKAGSGIAKIRQGWNSQHWRSPKVQEQVQPDRVRLVLPMMTMMPEESLDQLRNQFGKRFQGLDQDQVQALVTADVEDEVTNSRLQEITDKHSADLTKVLQGLVRHRFLVQQGQGRWTRYSLVPTKKNSAQREGGSAQCEENSAQSGDGSAQCETNSAQSDENAVQLLGRLSPSEWERLEIIAAPAASSRWLARKTMRKIILELCRGCFLTPAQLGALIQRQPASFRGRLLRPMVDEGLLVLRYPDQPNRPDQAYRTLL